MSAARPKDSDTSGSGVTPDDTKIDDSSGDTVATAGDLGGEKEAELEEAFDDLPSQARATLNWYDPRAGQYVYLCRLSPDQVRREFIRENFGGGRFKGRFRNGKVWGRTFEFVIDPAIPRRIPSWLTGADPASPSSASRSTEATAEAADPRGSGTGVSMDKLLMSEMMDLMRTGREMRAAQDNSATSMVSAVMSMMKGMSESTAALVASLGAAKPAGPDVADIIRLLDARNGAAGPSSEILSLRAEIAELRRSRGSDGDLGGMTRMVQFVDQLRGARGGRDDDDADDDFARDPLRGVARALLPPIVRALSGEPAPTGAPPAGASAMPPDSPPTPAAAPAPMTNPLELAYTAILDAAQSGEDPADFAVSLMHMTPRMFRGRVREFVGQPNASELVLDAYPDLRAYARWVGECIASLRESFQPADAPDGNTPPAQP